MIDEIHLNSHKFHQSFVTKQIACKPKPSSTKEASCHLPPFRRRDHQNLLSSVAAIASSQPSPVCRIAVDCKSDHHKPFLRSINLEVLNITLSDFTILVNHPVLNSCLSNESTRLENTPFLFSDRNRFVSVACDDFAIMSSNNSSLCGCLSICDGSQTFEMGNCFGVKCCQTTIPTQLKSYKASYNILNNNSQGENQKKCKYAFLVDRDLFSTSISAENVANIKQVPVLLNWNIQESSFNLDEKNKSHDYQSSTNCKALKDGSVHCLCIEGYGGNPYLPDGCQDVDECTTKNITCEPNMICKNTIGSYSCYHPGGSSSSKVYIIILGISAGLGSLFLLIGAWWLRTIVQKRKEIKLKEKFFKRNGGLLLQQQLTSSEASRDRCGLFSSRELDQATEHFNVNRILGQGGQGTVYKGMLTDGRIIAVKKSKVVDEGKLEEFINEVVVLSQINHRNVVKLLGCCLETEVPLLVYEYIPNGTLSRFGVVLVELLTGQKPTSITRIQDGLSLITNFIDSMEENSLNEILDNQVLSSGKKEEIMAIANIAKRCLNLKGRQRPTMKEIAMELEGIRAPQKDSNVQKNYEDIEYVRSEIIEAWDVISTSTGSSFENLSPSGNGRPLLTK
ncbi:hypothetical protein Q3G72_027965 [Acer saccharum]|nr:hypothetical protein Q3G72_027965 [Acer saccharum]